MPDPAAAREVEVAGEPGLGRLYLRAVVPRRRTLDQTLPAEVLVRRDVGVDLERLARYVRVCGFDLSDVLPATFPHLLTFPLQMQLMTAPGFPFPTVGLLHIRNEITVSRALRAGERLDVRVWAQLAEPHRRGRQVTLRSSVTADGQTAWESSSVYLHRERGSGGATESARPDPTPDSDAPTPSATWQLPADLGRRYAAISGDRNPIHLYPLSARLFGFRRHIAHGMWSAARCLAAVASRLPAAYRYDVTFRKPVPLPGSVALSVRHDATGDGQDLWLLAARGGSVHLLGRIDGEPVGRVGG